MAVDRDAVVLGSGTLYIDNVDVGHLTGPVTVHIERSGLTLPPDEPSYDEPTGFRTQDSMILRAASAEFNTTHLRLALGLSGDSIETISGSPSYNPASFDGTGNSYDVVHLGYASIDTTIFALRFEHTTAADKKVVVILYRALTPARIDLAFASDTFTAANIEFHAIQDDDRPVNERLGQILVEQ